MIRNTRDTMSEIYLAALKIRNEVFVKEQGVPYALEVENPVEEAAAVHFVYFDDGGKALATVRLLVNAEDRTLALVQRMAVIKEARGQGIAAQLLTYLTDFAREHGVQTLILHAQLSARGFYDKAGFLSEGEVFEEAGIRHITMKKFLPK